MPHDWEIVEPNAQDLASKFLAPFLPGAARAALLELNQSGTGVVLVARDDGEALGFCTVHASGQIDVFVHPDHQRRGYGLALVSEAVERGFNTRGLPMIWATTLPVGLGAALATAMAAREAVGAANERRFEITREEYFNR